MYLKIDKNRMDWHIFTGMAVAVFSVGVVLIILFLYLSLSVLTNEKIESNHEAQSFEHESTIVSQIDNNSNSNGNSNHEAQTWD